MIAFFLVLTVLIGCVIYAAVAITIESHDTAFKRGYDYVMSEMKLNDRDATTTRLLKEANDPFDDDSFNEGMRAALHTLRTLP